MAEHKTYYLRPYAEDPTRVRVSEGHKLARAIHTTPRCPAFYDRSFRLMVHPTEISEEKRQQLLRIGFWDCRRCNKQRIKPGQPPEGGG